MYCFFFYCFVFYFYLNTVYNPEKLFNLKSYDWFILRGALTTHMKLYNRILFCFGLQYSSDNTVCSLNFLKRSWFSYSKVSTSVVVSVLSTVVKGLVLTVVSS